MVNMQYFFVIVKFRNMEELIGFGDKGYRVFWGRVYSFFEIFIEGIF